jgi:hypothetical protein
MIGSIGLVPLAVGWIELSLFVSVLQVFRCRMMMEERHCGTIRDERHNAVCLILCELPDYLSRPGQ